MINTVILVAIGVAGLLIAEALYHLVMYRAEQKRIELKRRLRDLGRSSENHFLMKERRVAKNRTVDRFLRDFPMASRLEQLILQTDLTWTVSSVFAAMILLSLLFTVGLLMVSHGNLLSLLVSLPAGVGLPFLYLVNTRRRRAEKISAQLPEALEMIVRSLRAGHSLSAGFKLVASEMPAPIAIEFGRCFEEQNIGLEFRESLENLTRRVPGCMDLRIFAVSMIVQRETGGNLVEILQQLSTTIRDRYKFFGKLRSLTAEGRISCYILGALPFVCLLLIGLLNPKYLMPLKEDQAGPWIALGALVSWIVGFIWMRRMSKVDY